MNMKYQSITVLQNLLISNSQLAKTNLACATDETKLWLSPSAKQRRNPCSGPHLCIRIWVRNMIGLLKKAIVDLPIRMKEILNALSGNLLRLRLHKTAYASTLRLYQLSDSGHRNRNVLKPLFRGSLRPRSHESE